MSRYLVKHDGLFLGSSSACNLVACIKLVKKLGWNDGQRIVTILCVPSCLARGRIMLNDRCLGVTLVVGIIPRYDLLAYTIIHN